MALNGCSSTTWGAHVTLSGCSSTTLGAHMAVSGCGMGVACRQHIYMCTSCRHYRKPRITKIVLERLETQMNWLFVNQACEESLKQYTTRTCTYCLFLLVDTICIRIFVIVLLLLWVSTTPISHINIMKVL